MFLTNHALTGTLIGLEIEQPVVIAPAAFVSHFVMDSIPHFGYQPWGGFQNKKWLIMGSIDSALAALLTVGACILWPDRTARILLGSFSAMLPDLFYVPEIFFNVRLDKGLRRFHHWIQIGKETPAGALVEAVWLTGLIGLLGQLR